MSPGHSKTEFLNILSLEFITAPFRKCSISTNIWSKIPKAKIRIKYNIPVSSLNKMIQNRHKIIARVEKFWGEDWRFLLMDKKHLSILKHITVSPSKPMTLVRISGRLEKDIGE